MTLNNPIQIVIPLSIFQRTRQYKFHHNSSNEELLQLTSILKLEELKSFSFKGMLIETSKKDYTLKANLKATLVQNCIVSLHPVITKIENEISRFYSVEECKNKIKNISVNYESIEIDQIQRDVNIGEVMLEALSLEIPLYPKKGKIKFEGISITESGMQPLDKTFNNPFKSLKKLR